GVIMREKRVTQEESISKKVGAINEKHKTRKILWFGTGLRVRMMAGKQNGHQVHTGSSAGKMLNCHIKSIKKSVLMDLQ
ncbi:hypothetical protein, partial [Bacillus licheniformis]|uniref:hypothetical protein n=1 Tax=Bacillus licheniformis TaxID=1402 RepID=UPI00237CFE05